MPTSELLGTAEVAQLLSKDVRTVHRMIRRGEIPAQMLPGRTAAYIIRRADIDALLQSAGRAS
jgi:excisionase family DNA binding protein